MTNSEERGDSRKDGNSKSMTKSEIDSLPELLSAQEVRRVTGLHKPMVKKLVDAGKITCLPNDLKVGHRRFHKSSVLKLCLAQAAK
jgi:hypothetical protein